MPNYGIVEGPWGNGNYTFRKIQPEDWEKIIKHIKTYFLRDEPTCKILGYTDEFGSEFEALAKRLLLDNLSFWVEHNETGDVAAVRVTFRHKRDTSFADLPMNSITLKWLFKLVEMCHQRCDLFERYQLDEYADFFVASCAPKYRQQGLTKELYRRSLKFLAAEGFKMAKSVFTSPYSRAAARSLGFEECCRVDYPELLDDEGLPVFDPKDLTEESYAVILAKVL